jgi:hypothetical protein
VPPSPPAQFAEPLERLPVSHLFSCFAPIRRRHPAAISLLWWILVVDFSWVSPLDSLNVFKFMDVSKDSVVVLPVATASPVASAAEYQQENDDKQEQIHGIPPFRMRRGGVALPITSAILYASLQIQLLAELKTNAPNAKKFRD